MVSFRDISSGLKQLELDPAWPVIAHASLSAFGEVRGGAETLLGALLAQQRAVMMPAFTYKTMLVPEEGPEDNGEIYGSGRDQNQMAEFFKPDMPVDGALGAAAELLRKQPGAGRSAHPILSFTGVGVGDALRSQTLAEPLKPVGVLAGQGGWVLLLGVDHTANTSIHYAERLAGRAQFVRWALTHHGVCECLAFPGCSNGFAKAGPWLEDITRRVQIGGAVVSALPLQPMLARLVDQLRRDRLALLCDQIECPNCSAVRRRAQRQVEIGPVPEGGYGA